MSKDTIYIDVEDDITAIIGKVKAAKSNIVALVPPKRIGVLQSAVNLRLLSRAAEQNNKRLVLISGNSALTALAASAGIPAARTLQSKPELMATPDDQDDHEEDVIDGAKLPVGDLAKTDGDIEAGTAVALAAPAIDSAIRANAAEEAAVSPLPRPPKAKNSGIKVPNFDTFRKRLALGAGALVLLIGFLVWAIWFAPNATIAITARTIETSANPSVVLATSASTNAGSGTVKAVQQDKKIEATLDFEATGEKDIGDKAAGTVTMQICSGFSTPAAIPAGTSISAAGNSYTTGAAASFTQTSIGNGCINYKSNTVGITAAEGGTDSNISNATFQVSGSSATAQGSASGGTDKTIAVVTKEDFDQAVNKFVEQVSEGSKNDLVAAFGDDTTVIDSSFKINKDGIASVPAVDAEAPDGKAKLNGSLNFTMIGVEKSELDSFLDAYFEEQIEDENQRVYENGSDKTTFVDVKAAEGDNGFTATMTATAKLGPKIDDDNVKNQAKGKKYGEVQSAIEGISGVESVDIKFSPFWVRTVPDDEERITIEFNLDESE